jgi:hypothetical protein
MYLKMWHIIDVAKKKNHFKQISLFLKYTSFWVKKRKKKQFFTQNYSTEQNVRTWLKYT